MPVVRYAMPAHRVEEISRLVGVSRLSGAWSVRFLSLGAGVQSSTIYLMACEGQEQIDAAIFADTGWEPWWVYQHLDGLEKVGKAAGIPIYRVQYRNLRTDALANRTELRHANWQRVY